MRKSDYLALTGVLIVALWAAEAEEEGWSEVIEEGFRYAFMSTRE